MKNQNKHQPKVNPMQTDKIGRFKPKLLKHKIFFKLIICRKSFHSFPNFQGTLVNLHLLLMNRTPSSLFLVSSNQLNLVAAMDLGFCSLPINEFLKHDQTDFMLNLMENYLI